MDTRHSGEQQPKCSEASTAEQDTTTVQLGWQPIKLERILRLEPTQRPMCDLRWVLGQIGRVPALAQLPSKDERVETCRKLRWLQLSQGERLCTQGMLSPVRLVILLRGVLRVQIDGVDRCGLGCRRRRRS